MTSGLVTLRFTTKGHVGSRIAAALVDSDKFNHCMILHGGLIYEAVTWHGVRAVSPRIAMRGVVCYQEMAVWVPNIGGTVAFLIDQLGAGYDWPGAIGLPLRHGGDWQDPARWWCFELAVAAIGAGGTWMVDPNDPNSVTPKAVFSYPAAKFPIVDLRAA